MPEEQVQSPWPDPPPTPKAALGTRAWTVLRALRASGWLRPRRIGCLLLIFMILLFAVLWAVGSAIDGITAMFGPDPVAGSPFDKVAPTRAPGTGPPTVELVVGGKLTVAVQEFPGLVQRDARTGAYSGFEIALLEVIARGLGVDPGGTLFKSVPAGSAVGMLTRREADLALGGFAVTPQRRAEVGIAGPYLMSELRLAVPSNSPVTSLDSSAPGKVCASRDSPAASALAGRLNDRLMTRASLGACENLLGSGVTAIVGDELALRRLPATVSGELRLLGEPLGESTEYGIGLAPDNDMLRDRVNAALRKAIDDGTWTRLYQEHLGTPVPAPPTIR